MANKRENVTTAKPKISGSIFAAPLGTTLPVDAVAELDPAFKCLGYAGDDGVKNSNKTENNKIKAWGGDVVLNYAKEKNDTFQVKLLEVLNEDVIKTVCGEENVSGTISTGLTINVNDKNPIPHVYVVDMILRDNVIKRIVVPNGTITEVAEVVYKGEDPYSYDITIAADTDANGNTHYEYIKKGEV